MARMGSKCVHWDVMEGVIFKNPSSRMDTISFSRLYVVINESDGVWLVAVMIKGYDGPTRSKQWPTRVHLLAR